MAYIWQQFDILSYKHFSYIHSLKYLIKVMHRMTQCFSYIAQTPRFRVAIN